MREWEEEDGGRRDQASLASGSHWGCRVSRYVVLAGERGGAGLFCGSYRSAKTVCVVGVGHGEEKGEQRHAAFKGKGGAGTRSMKKKNAGSVCPAATDSKHGTSGGASQKQAKIS